MDNQKPYDNDAFAVLPLIHDEAAELDTVVFTRAEWEADDESEALGARRIVPKAKEKAPGVKVMLISRDSFLCAKQRTEECTFIWPIIDLSEIVSTMIDVCDADLAVIEEVGKKTLKHRV